MKELELIDIFCKYLDEKNIEYKREVRKGIYHNEGYIDVLIKMGNEYHAIEAKITAYKSVIKQACENKTLVQYSWILTNKKPSGYHIMMCKKDNIGIFSLCNGKIEVISNPDDHIGKFFVTSKYETLDRNWRMNRYGRKFKDNEIPDGYDKEKLKKLQKKNKGMNRKEYYTMIRERRRARSKEYYKKQKEYRKKVKEEMQNKET